MYSPTKTSFYSGIALLIYGYLCRILNIYFFWDSKEIGWIILSLALLFCLFDLHKSKKLQGKKTIWIKIGIGMLIFGFLVFPIVLYKIKNSEAYKAAVDYLKSNPEIKKSIGNINGFGLVPTGQVQTISVNGMESGNASFQMTIQGDKKYKDVKIMLNKTPGTGWNVVSLTK